MKTVEERFLEKVSKDGPWCEELNSRCWEWQGSISTSGYGHMWFDGKLIDAHRISYVIFRGGIPENLMVLHGCNNKRCVNPAHLRTGTQVDNMADYLSTKVLMDAETKRAKRRTLNQKYYYDNQEKLCEYARNRRVTIRKI